MPDPFLSRWQTFHFHYHERQDRLLEDLLRPLVASLVKRREIDSFFFVRFLLGGPHIRLRVRLCGDQLTVAEEVQRRAGLFFSTVPSRASLPEEKIRAINRDILQSDPAENDDSIYPDNSVQLAPFHPEIERYGGTELFPETLAYFAISSCRVLRWLHQQRGDPGPRLSFAFHLLGLQALGFAKDGPELLGLLRYPVPSWEAAPPLLVERGDQAFEQQRGSYLQVLRRRIEEIVDRGFSSEDVLAERALDGVLRGVPGRRRILSSHLHMTANRLGLRNGEEIYLARLLWRTFTELAAAEPTLWSRLESTLVERASPRSLEDCVPAQLQGLYADG